MSNYEGFKPVHVSLEEYKKGGPAAKTTELVKGQDPSDEDSVYVMMLALKRNLLHYRRAAMRLAQPTEVRYLSDDFHAVKFTVFDANLEPELEADTIFKGDRLFRPMNIIEPFRLGGQAIKGAYFLPHPGADAERPADAGGAEAAGLSDFLRRVPALGDFAPPRIPGMPALS
jgi:hypothetical protein